MIVFTDVRRARRPPAPRGRASKAHARSPRLAELEQELVRVRGEARATREEMQTSQEELQSANEELQSTNEELQSTNEELTTSKEEMQSLNEELQTVNAELQAKVDELSRASNDMKNLLDSTDIATLFLDNDLNVRRFTPQATKIIKLIPGDVGPADHRPGVRPGLPGAGRRRARGAADAALHGEAGRRARRPLVHRAHHALPHAGRPDRRRRDHLRRHHRGQDAGGEAARPARQPRKGRAAEQIREPGERPGRARPGGDQPRS